VFTVGHGLLNKQTVNNMAAISPSPDYCGSARTRPCLRVYSVLHGGDGWVGQNNPSWCPQGEAIMPRTERPLDAAGGVLTTFAADLRLLRQKAGSPTYRELAKRAHYSIATLSNAANGRLLPSLAATLAYVRACDGDVDEWERRWRAVADELALADEQTDSTAELEQSPYIGLATFQIEDAGRFFGRDRLIERLVERVSRQRLVAVIGASGSGKSSLLRAGLLPALAETDDPPRVLIMTPRERPLHEYAIRLAAETGTDPDLLTIEPLHPDRLAETVEYLAARFSAGAEFILVVDQFEEIFTTCRNPREAAAFVATLLAAATDSTRTRVVLSMRSDFYGYLARHPSLMEALEDAQTLVGPMTVAELHEAITRPAVTSGYTVETTLVTRLVAESAGQPGMLPLVSHALLETWRRRRGNALTLAGYEAAGGVERALSRTAENAYLAMDKDGQDTARRVFLRLIALEEGTWPTKRRVSRGELDYGDNATAATSTITAVVDHLVQARLLTTDGGHVELSHEALISSWPRLADWLAEDQTGLRTHHALSQASRQWDSLGRDPGSLYRGTRLDQALDWHATHPDALNPVELEFLRTSRSERDRDQAVTRRRVRRTRQLVALLTVFLVLTVVATVFASRAAQTATEQRNTALSAKVAAQASALRTANPALAAQLSLAAYRLIPAIEARSSLLSAFATPYATRITGHATRINAVAFRADGHVLATAGDDNTVRLWNVEDPHHPSPLATLPDQGTAVRTIAFSATGGLLVVASARTVTLWDIADSRHPQELSTFGNSGAGVQALALHPAGALLATTGASQQVQLWDISDPRRPRVTAALPGSADAVASVAFHPRQPVLATASRDGTIRLWETGNAEQPSELATRRPNGERVETVTFHPHGNTLATAGADRTVRLWNVADPRNPFESAVLAGHTDTIYTAVFAPDGNSMATAGWDQDIRLWNTSDPHRPSELAVLPGHTGSVHSIAYSPGGTTLATGSWDHTVWLRDLAGTTLAGHQDTVSSMALTPDAVVTTGWDGTVRIWAIRDGQLLNTVNDHKATDNKAAVYASATYRTTLATAGEDGTIHLFDLADPRAPARLGVIGDSTDPVRALAFSPDGRTLAVSSEKTVRLWDVSDPSRPIGPTVLAGHTATVRALAYSPDGRTLASAGDDQVIRLWNVTDPHRPVEAALLTGHTEAVRAVTFSPAAQALVATAGMDGTIRLWDVTDTQRPTAMFVSSPHSHAFRTVSFSPDGRLLASGGDDRIARLWDVTASSQLTETAMLTGHTKAIWATAFTPDGTALATAGQDRTAIMWHLDADRTAAKICDLTSPSITQAEWQQYFPDLTYQPPCG
jgi:WD40 repeat protein/energy-coupling factor transporter ATP-binding protein EcfA2